MRPFCSTKITEIIVNEQHKAPIFSLHSSAEVAEGLLDKLTHHSKEMEINFTYYPHPKSVCYYLSPQQCTVSVFYYHVLVVTTVTHIHSTIATHENNLILNVNNDLRVSLSRSVCPSSLRRRLSDGNVGNGGDEDDEQIVLPNRGIIMENNTITLLNGSAVWHHLHYKIAIVFFSR